MEKLPFYFRLSWQQDRIIGNHELRLRSRKHNLIAFGALYWGNLCKNFWFIPKYNLFSFCLPQCKGNRFHRGTFFWIPFRQATNWNLLLGNHYKQKHRNAKHDEMAFSAWSQFCKSLWFMPKHYLFLFTMKQRSFWLQSGNQIRSLEKRDELRPRSGQQDVTPGGMEQKRAPSCLIVMGTLVKVQLPFLSSNGASTWRPPSDSVCFWCQVLQDSGFSLLKCFFFSASCAMKCAPLDVADLQALTFL